MALQTFTAGQVLTAAQVTALQANDYNQTVSNKTDSYVLVAADKGTRVVMNKATATTITVNTDLFNAGDTLWIQNIGAGTCTITAGTATVTTGSNLALAQWQGGTLYFTSTGAAIFFLAGSTGSAGLKDADISGTTGSPTTTTFTESSVNYKTYAFTGSGTITTTKAGVCEVVIIAGGGGGGAQGSGGRSSGGGGAGGYFAGAFTLPLGATTITIGGGGAGGVGSAFGTNGVNSQIASTNYGVLGGGGGAPHQNNGRTGGSGGGASADGVIGGTTLTPYQGNNGANSVDGNNAGGGGGAGAAGSGKNGGTGVTSTINGTSTQRAGGGGGGYGGTATGGGGAGAASTNGIAATANTGGGGGGSGMGNGGAGGSGIIFIRVLA
jgi:hypothetical protein